MCPLKTLKPFSTNWLCFHSTKLKAPFLWMCRKQSITTSGPKRKWCIRMELAQWALRMLWCEGFWFLDSCDPLLRYDCCNAHYSCVLQVWAASSSAPPIMRQYTLAPLPCGRPLPSPPPLPILTLVAGSLILLLRNLSPSSFTESNHHSLPEPCNQPFLHQPSIQLVEWGAAEGEFAFRFKSRSQGFRWN